MLESYSRAVTDPEDELVHLYEIRDAAAKHFGNDQAAIKALGLNPSDWRDLGELANNAPLKEGRHRGRQSTARRAATEEELTRARVTGRQIIENFARAT